VTRCSLRTQIVEGIGLVESLGTKDFEQTLQTMRGRAIVIGITRGKILGDLFTGLSTPGQVRQHRACRVCLFARFLANVRDELGDQVRQPVEERLGVELIGCQIYEGQQGVLLDLALLLRAEGYFGQVLQDARVLE